MLSIGTLLSSYKNHLPPNWAPSQGLRSLFPPGYSGSISQLRNYVVFYHHQLATQGYGSDGTLVPSCYCNFWVMADGTGHWFFGWIYGKSFLNSSYARQTGFVFNFSPDGNGRGYVDTDRSTRLNKKL